MNIQFVIKLLFLTLLAVSHHSIADDISDEEEKLERYEQTYENYQVDIEDTENEIFVYSSKVNEARADLDVAVRDQVRAAAELKAATDAAEATPGADSDRILRLATHSYSMAERGVKTRTKRLERVEGNLTDLQALLQDQQSQTARYQRRIAEQKQRIIAVQQEVAADARAREEEARIAAVAAAAAPKAAQAQKSAATTAAVAAAPVKMAPVKATAPAAKAKAKSAAELSELDREALEYAKKEMARLNGMLADGAKGKPMFRQLFLKGSHIQPAEFEFLGKDQYRVDVVVSKGRQNFEVGQKSYRRTIPASDDGQAYVFIVDAKRASHLRMIMFKKSLLQHLK